MLTTSDAGQAFLAAFDIDAAVLSRHYAVQFDERQNMLRDATDRNVAHYVFRPTRMLRDIARLRAIVRDADLVINDSFHPALLFMGAMPGWRRRIVHVYGGSLRRVDREFRCTAAARTGACICTDRRLADRFGAVLHRTRLAYDAADAVRRSCAHYRLPTPVPIVAGQPLRNRLQPPFI